MQAKVIGFCEEVLKEKKDEQKLEIKIHKLATFIVDHIEEIFGISMGEEVESDDEDAIKTQEEFEESVDQPGKIIKLPFQPKR